MGGGGGEGESALTCCLMLLKYDARGTALFHNGHSTSRRLDTSAFAPGWKLLQLYICACVKLHAIHHLVL